MYQVSDFDQPMVGQADDRQSAGHHTHRQTASKTVGTALLGILALVVLWAQQSALARSAASPSTACEPHIDFARAVVRLTGTSSMRLDDGTEVKLAGILLPHKLDAAGKPETWPPAATARAELNMLTVGKSVEIAEQSGRRDRYGRRSVDMFVRARRERLWLQAQLVAAGQARVNPEPLTNACANILLAHEAAARRARRGLWDNAAYNIRNASNHQALMRYRSTFQLVEGIVRDVTTVRSRTFINFGNNWRTDFTAGIQRRTLAGSRINARMLAAMKGRRVRIRGWIVRRGGPFITIRSMKQIELVPSQTLANDKGDRKPPVQPTGPDKQKRPDQKDPDAIDL